LKKRFIAALCALLLLCALPFALPAADAAPETVYFMSVNDTVMDLNDATMPFFANGVLYVPYTMFDPDTAGSGLGVFSSYSRSKAAVIIYGWGGTLLFDLQKNNSTFGSKTYSDSAIQRNSTVFVPLDMVCRCFKLEWSWLMVDHGYIIRVKSDSASLDDRNFAHTASYTLNERYKTYIQNKAPRPSAPVVTPSPPVKPADGAQIRFAFRMADEGNGFSELLAELASARVYGLFLCHPDDLAVRDDQIRALLASGHKVGLLLDADSLDGQLEQLAEGKHLLSRIAHTPLSMALSTGLNEEDAAALRESVTLWTSTVEATDETLTAAQRATLVSRTVVDDGSYFILMDDSSSSADSLMMILSSLTQKGCEFRPVTEVSLSTLK